jgi:hypothetical protein
VVVHLEKEKEETVHDWTLTAGWSDSPRARPIIFSAHSAAGWERGGATERWPLARPVTFLGAGYWRWSDARLVHQLDDDIQWRQLGSHVGKNSKKTRRWGVLDWHWPDASDQRKLALDALWTWSNAKWSRVRSFLLWVRSQLNPRALDQLTVGDRRSVFKGHDTWRKIYDWCIQSVCRAASLGTNDSIHLETPINSVWLAPRYLSWHFDILNILMSLRKHLSLISIINSSS